MVREDRLNVCARPSRCRCPGASSQVLLRAKALLRAAVVAEEPLVANALAPLFLGRGRMESCAGLVGPLASPRGTGVRA